MNRNVQLIEPFNIFASPQIFFSNLPALKDNIGY